MSKSSNKKESQEPLNGYLCDSSWLTPVMVIECKKEARPGYSDIPGHEYNEANEEVLMNKVRLLAKMILTSSNLIAYTGAGISTSAGISDYASRSAGAMSQVHELINGTSTITATSAVAKPSASTQDKSTEKPATITSLSMKGSTKYVSPIVAAYSAVDTPIAEAKSSTKAINKLIPAASKVVAPVKPKSSLAARPTFAHHTLTRLYEAGYLKWWCQQNHDGLPQKAGLPQHAINEIHGSWFDPSNRVVQFSESLRDDLCKDMYEWQEKADVVLAVGTSLSGMAADEIVTVVSTNAIRRLRKFKKEEYIEKVQEDGHRCGGSVIIGFQRTSHDDKAALRIYSSIEQVFRLLVEVLPEEAGRINDGHDAIDVPRLRDILSSPIVDDPQRWLKVLHPTGKVFPETGSRVIIASTVFEIVGYDAVTGKKVDSISPLPMVRLDLRPGKRLKLTIGMEEGCIGIVDGVSSSAPTASGNISITWQVPVKSKDPGTNKVKKSMGQATRVFGLWNLVSALEGKLSVLPFVNA